MGDRRLQIRVTIVATVQFPIPPTGRFWGTAQSLRAAMANKNQGFLGGCIRRLANAGRRLFPAIYPKALPVKLYPRPN